MHVRRTQGKLLWLTLVSPVDKASALATNSIYVPGNLKRLLFLGQDFGLGFIRHLDLYFKKNEKMSFKKFMENNIWLYLELIRYNGELVLFSKYLYDVFVLFALDHNFSANILLDDQFQPKLTDFAMAHIRPHLEPQSSVLSMTSSSSKHLWYMPEEYIRQGKLSVKTDVYSFGIVSTNYQLTK